jgi:hypothetical protein
MVEYDIRQAQQTVFLLGNLQYLFDFMPSGTVCTQLTRGKHSGIISVLVADRVGAVALTALLQRWVVKHGITSFLCFGEVRLPFVNGPHPFANHGQDGKPVQRQIDVVVLDNSSFARGKDGKGRIEDRRASLEFEHRVDIEIPGVAFDSDTRRALVFDPVLVSTGLRNGEVDLNRL